MFGLGKKKEPKEKPKYKAMFSWGDRPVYYKVYEYKLLENGVIEMRTTEGEVVFMPGSSCVIESL